MYTPTPINYYEDYIQHGWLKDQAAKAHKYLDRWRGKNGKWYYRYKSKAQELGTKIRRKLKGINNNEVTSDYGRHPGPKKYGKFSNSKSLSQRNVNAGLEAGRKRAKKKATTERFNAHMSSKSVRKGGYSGSRGSSSNNRATDTALKNQQTKRTMTNKIKNKQPMVPTKSLYKRYRDRKAYKDSDGRTVYGTWDQMDFVNRANGRHRDEVQARRTKSTKKRRRYLSGTGKISTKSHKNLYQVKKGQTKSFYDYYKKK